MTRTISLGIALLVASLASSCAKFRSPTDIPEIRVRIQKMAITASNHHPGAALLEVAGIVQQTGGFPLDEYDLAFTAHAKRKHAPNSQGSRDFVVRMIDRAGVFKGDIYLSDTPDGADDISVSVENFTWSEPASPPKRNPPEPAKQKKVTLEISTR